MEKPVKGEIVVIPFPFTDLTSSKKRPALVLANLKGDDVILCQITSQTRKDDYAISLENNDFAKGKLPLESFIRPNRLFTADQSLIDKRIGSLKKNKSEEVIEEVCKILKK
jgi:mRNA interferase MazF